MKIDLKVSRREAKVSPREPIGSPRVPKVSPRKPKGTKICKLQSNSLLAVT